MRVLVVTNMYPDKKHPYYGIFVAEQIEAIKRNHPNVCFDVCYVNGLKGKWEYLKSVFYVNRKIRKEKYDLVHIHFGLSGLYLLSPFTSHVPTIVTFHGSDIQPAGGNGALTINISRLVAKMADACITLNEKMDAMVRRYNEQTFIVPCAVDEDIFIHNRSIQEKEVVRVVFPSDRHVAVKNYPLFRKVLDILKEQYGIVCEGKEVSGLSRMEVASLFNESSLLLVTSISEGSPQVVKEAMACNLPIVSTPVGDVPNLLNGVKDCYVSETYEADELARLAVKSLSHKGSGLTGRELIFALHLNAKSVADAIYCIYERFYNREK